MLVKILLWLRRPQIVLAPVTSLPSFLTTFLKIYPPSHADLLLPHTQYAHSHLRSFELADLSAWNAPLPNICMVCSHFIHNCSNFNLTERPSLIITKKMTSLVTLCLLILLYSSSEHLSPLTIYICYCLSSSIRIQAP